MGKYVLKRLLHGVVSIILVVFIVMLLVYGLMNRDLVFAKDGNFGKQVNNNRRTYMLQQWELFGYLDYVPYADYMLMLRQEGEIDEETRAAAAKIGRDADGSSDSELTVQYIKQFTEYYESKGYTVERLGAKLSRGKIAAGGQPALFAYKDNSLLERLWTYFAGLVQVDNIHYVPEYDDIGERGLTFTLYDPLYGGEKFSPAIIGNGTKHKYLFYFDNRFPYIHQNLATVNLGASFSISRGVDVFTTMTQSQGSWVQSMITYPTGLSEMSADDLHTATYIAGSRDSSEMLQARFV
ncbi:MAG: ABC transporter permease, partial [Acetatifactor sp.]|nr:ABC transporter permease [Acetatifactor sp.]